MATNGKSNGKSKGNGQWVGKRFKRKEDPRLVRGISHYTDDIKLPNLVHCVFVRSPHAHARILSINADAARSHPGVLAVVTSADLEGLGMIPCAMQMPDLKVPPHPALAKGHVRYVGEPVAAVVAEDPYTARDAAEMVAVDYEPLPVVLDMEKALGKDSALIYQDFGSNRAFTHAMKSGDINAAFKKAERVVKVRLLNQRVAPTAMRIPISWMRRDTEYEITPNTPLAASSSDIAANKASSKVRNLGCATELSRISDMVATAVTGRSLSKFPTSCRICCATLEAPREVLDTSTTPGNGACAKGTYIMGPGSWARATSRTSPTTPTISRGTLPFGGNPNASCLPSGSWLGK